MRSPICSHCNRLLYENIFSDSIYPLNSTWFVPVTSMNGNAEHTLNIPKAPSSLQQSHQATSTYPYYIVF